MAIATVGATPVFSVKAGELVQLFEKKFELAELLEIASFAANHCPGIRVSDDAVTAVIEEEGITDDDIKTSVWRFSKSRGQMKAKNGYSKDSRGWCDRTFRRLGPYHLPDVKRALLLGTYKPE